MPFGWVALAGPKPSEAWQLQPRQPELSPPGLRRGGGHATPITRPWRGTKSVSSSFCFHDSGRAIVWGRRYAILVVTLSEDCGRVWFCRAGTIVGARET